LRGRDQTSGPGVELTMMDATQVRYPVAARLDRLPIASFHTRMMWSLGFVFFFELGDIYTFAFAAPALLKTWNLSIQTISFITSATFIGMFIGATTGGWLADRVGRKRGLLLSTLWYSGFSLLNALVWGPGTLFATRMLTGIGLSAMTIIGITYISEMYPASRRGAYQGWVMTIGLVGVPVTAYVARFCIPIADWGWRLVFVWGSLGLFFPLLAPNLEESPRWHENHGRPDEADAIMDRIEAGVRQEHGTLPAPLPAAPVVPRRGGYAELWSPGQLPRTTLLIVVWVAQTLGFHGFTAWIPTLLVAKGFSLVRSLTWSSAISIGTIPGALIAALVSDRWERKWSIPIVALLIAAFGLLYGLSSTAVTIVVFGFLVEMCLRLFASLLYSYTPECFPTAVRSSGAGLTYGVGRLANIVGPLVIAFLFNRLGYMSVFVYIAATWVVVAVAVSVFGPATRRRLLQ
jgi:putative MFS transporter